jgi:hypothetical protein
MKEHRSRLETWVRSQLALRLRARVDPEDIVRYGSRLPPRL